MPIFTIFGALKIARRPFSAFKKYKNSWKNHYSELLNVLKWQILDSVRWKTNCLTKNLEKIDRNSLTVLFGQFSKSLSWPNLPNSHIFTKKPMLNQSYGKIRFPLHANILKIRAMQFDGRRRASAAKKTDWAHANLT